ncbi:glycoside hydrolase family 43 protein [Dinghuibacter silviterrae]|uniref:Beta-xylosidase n=1 Tax=Dinghuibacter silviterrae TaxID=1539049 RepID=A0A4V3GLP8_9BACT|nr:glycoside hydrolase 43 family protein [Dinghuibacter silviterrae]TDX00363.1 beta-xylosidase [Dinghuibacter silviterrae]
MKRYALLMLLTFPCVALFAQHVYTPDNGDGTFTNPLLWGDWPDPDVIRVGDDFYLISTSMHYVPGSPVLHSKDLVNWEMAGYAVARYDEDPRYDMKGGTMYLNGSWANTIRYHNGKFYVGFCTPSGIGAQGHFSMCVADSVQGPWKRTIFPEYLYDPGLFFDDDGKVYVVHGQGTLYLTELNSDALSVKSPRVKIWSTGFDRDGVPGHHFGLEGSHVYKINGLYYITCPAGGTEGWQVCLRSKNIYGPYEYRTIVHDDGSYPPNGLHQGGLVQLKNGDWWFIIMQDRGPLGRVPHLEPVVWKDGWPMIGREAKGVVTWTKPDVGSTYPVCVPTTSDAFDNPVLGLQWQWNHNPDNSKWSLTEHPGYLRLHGAFATGLMEARNSLTQRVQGPQSTGVAEVDLEGMADGDLTGLAVFQKPYAFIGVEQRNGYRRLVMADDGKIIDSTGLGGQSTVWFRASATDKGFVVTFSYSLDGVHFQPLGSRFVMQLGLDWTANRFMLFDFNDIPGAAPGFADFNNFYILGE